MTALAGVARGAAVALLGSLLGGGLGFVFTVVMARLLSRADFGLLVLAITVLQLGAALTIAGLDYTVVRDVAAAPDDGRRRGAMITPLGLALALNAAAAAVLVAAASPIADALDEPGFVTPLRMLAIVLPLTVGAQMLSACMSGLERASGELVRKVAEQGGRVVLGPVGLALGVGVTGVVAGLAAAAAVAVVAVAAALLRILPRGGVTVRRPVGDVASFAWPQAAANVLALWQVPGVLVLARSKSSREVAVYGAAVALGVLPALVYNAFAYRFSPTIARLWAAGDRDELGFMLKAVTRWVALASLPFYAIAIFLAAPLLALYGGSYRAGGATLALIACANALNALTGPVEWALIMTGRVKLELLANAVGAVVLVVATVLLVPDRGAAGAAAAVLLYAIVINGLKTLFVGRRLGMSTVSPALAVPLCAAVGAGCAGLLGVRATALDDSLAGTVALALLVLAAYALLVAPESRRELRALREHAA